MKSMIEVAKFVKRKANSVILKYKTEKNKKQYLTNELDNEDLVSVVMTVYNREQYLRKAIESVLNQSYQNFELIIINDGSEDKSEEIIKSFSDTRIKYYRKQNEGQLKAFKDAYSKVSGKYILRADSDDILDKDIISLCLSNIKEKELDFVYFNLNNIDKNNNSIFVSTLKKYINGSEVARDIFINFHSVIPDVAFWKEEYLHNVVEFYINKNIPFYINTLNTAKFDFVDLPLYNYRHHCENYVSNNENLKFVLGGIRDTIEYLIEKYDKEFYLSSEELYNPYYSIAKRYVQEARKYIEGYFGSYQYEKQDKVFTIFSEQALKWIQFEQNEELKREIIEEINSLSN